MCTSLDSILKCVKSNYNIEDLATLQAAENKGQDLNKFLMSKSDLMCVSLFESFCIILSIDSNRDNMILLLKQILQAGVEQKKEKVKIKEVDQTQQSTEHKFVPDPTPAPEESKQEEAKTEEVKQEDGAAASGDGA